MLTNETLLYRINVICKNKNNVKIFLNLGVKHFHGFIRHQKKKERKRKLADSVCRLPEVQYVVKFD